MKTDNVNNLIMRLLKHPNARVDIERRSISLDGSMLRDGSVFIVRVKIIDGDGYLEYHEHEVLKTALALALESLKRYERRVRADELRIAKQYNR